MNLPYIFLYKKIGAILLVYLAAETIIRATTSSFNWWSDWKFYDDKALPRGRASRHHGNPIKGPPETPRTSWVRVEYKDCYAACVGGNCIWNVGGVKCENVMEGENRDTFLFNQVSFSNKGFSINTGPIRIAHNI